MPKNNVSGKEKFKDWRVLEFFVPIKETASVGNDFFIKGVAINETTTRNGVKYIASELEKAAPSFRGKPILLDHSNSVKNIVGRTTDKVFFNSNIRGIEFEAKIMDKEIQHMINDGRITDVSIGAKVENLEQNKDDNSVTAIGVEGLEISLVAVPGDPGAGIASALENSFTLREQLRNENSNEETVGGYETISKLKQIERGDLNDMESKIKEEVETPEVAPVAVPEDKPVEEPAKEEPEKASEEKTENANLAIENAVLKERLRNAEEIAKLTKENAELTKVKEVESSKTMVVEKTPEVKDKTKGVISSGETEEKDTNGYVVEKAETGKGFALYKDYSKTKSGEFNRLVP